MLGFHPSKLDYCNGLYMGWLLKTTQTRSVIVHSCSLNKWCCLPKKNGSTVFLDVSLNLSSTYKAPWPCTAFVDAKGSVSVAFSAAESNLKCNEITHVQGTLTLC